jgi:CRP/FNR family transcriptional regulator
MTGTGAWPTHAYVIERPTDRNISPIGHRDRCLRTVYELLGIDEQIFDQIEYDIQRRIVRSGNNVFTALESLTHIYFIVSGTVKIQFELEGEPYIFDFASSGELIGLDGIATSIYVNTAIAISDVVLISLPYSEFIQQRRKSTKFNDAIIKCFGEKICRASMFLGVMARGSADKKIAFLLMNLSRKAGTATQPAREIDLGITRAEIALHLGLAYETVVKVLGVFRSEKIISIHGHIITIENRKALQDICALHTKR